MLMTLLLIILIVAVLGGLQTWPYSREWGLRPERRKRSIVDHRNHSVADARRGSVKFAASF
jgi:Protein of unknown function (DUF3309)